VFRISDFSRFTRISTKTLRHYDRLGLLRPAHVDAETRYRYYSATQVPRLQRVLALREAGFTLQHIAEILDEDPRGRTMKRLLELRRTETERRVEEERRRLADLEARLRAIEAGPGATPPDVVLQAVPAMRAGVRDSGPPLLTYHDRDYRETDADVEVVVPATRTGAKRLRIRTLPQIPLAAYVTYAGSYEQWTSVTCSLLAWLEARRLAPSGSLREVYLQFGARRGEELPPQFLVEHEEDLLTELQIPVCERIGRAKPRKSGVAGAEERGASAKPPRRR
jgi:DNA-binding transcriptional MerR regulator